MPMDTRQNPGTDRQTARPQARQYRILLVDDHPIVRDGLKSFLAHESDLIVCGEAESVQEAKALLRKLEPDVLVVDLSLKHGDGIELVRDARARYPTLKILVLSMHDELLYAERLIAAGATGYLMKRSAAAELVPSIRKILTGAVSLSDAVSERLIERLAGGPESEKDNPVAALSDRELQVLNMIGRGLSTREIGEELNLSIKTIESHRQRIKRKLSLSTSAQLVQYAVSWYSGRSTG